LNLLRLKKRLPSKKYKTKSIRLMHKTQKMQFLSQLK
jgi:hypothetical protein